MSIREIQQKRLEGIFEEYNKNENILSEDSYDPYNIGGDYFVPNLNKFEGTNGVTYTKREFDQEFNSFWNSYVADIKKDGNEVIEKNTFKGTLFGFDYKRGRMGKYGIKMYPRYSNSLSWKVNSNKAMKLVEKEDEVTMLRFVCKSVDDRIQFLMRKYKLRTICEDDVRIIKYIHDVANHKMMPDVLYSDFLGKADFNNVRKIWLEGSYKGEKGSLFSLELTLNLLLVFQWAFTMEINRNSVIHHTTLTARHPKFLEIMKEEIIVYRAPINAIKDEKWRVI